MNVFLMDMADFLARVLSLYSFFIWIRYMVTPHFFAGLLYDDST